ncbi:MAG: hypothetical protein M9962_00090 [Oligoflexia bacterium]|nr:hypothetical protein [Oligoflexia bacterium]
MKLPSREDMMEFVEGDAGLNAHMHRQILDLIASSKVVREQVTELKQDLYWVDSQVPDYLPGVSLGLEITRLTKSWGASEYKRSFSLKDYYRAKEFTYLMLFLFGGVLMLFILVNLWT